MPKRALTYLLFAHNIPNADKFGFKFIINNDGTGWFLPKVNYFSALRFP